MPELPEVETIVQELKAKKLVGKKIVQAKVALLKLVSPIDLAEKLAGQEILQVFRRAKFIVLKLTDFYLTVHLRMTGHFFLRPKSLVDSQKAGKHEHIFLILDDGSCLVYEDIRQFGKFILIEKAKLDDFFAHLGPEPLDEKTFVFSSFFKMLKSKKTKIKPLLLDQKFIAGLGNIYANEALFLAGIHPGTLAYKISKLRAEKLFKSIKEVLNKAILNKGTSLGHNALNFCGLENQFGQNRNFLLVHEKKDELCSICGKEKIQKKTIAQRSCYFCPKCQPEIK